MLNVDKIVSMARREAAVTRSIHAAIIGCGAFAGAALVPAMRLANLDIVAVCNRTAASAEAARVATGAATSFCDIDDLIAAGGFDAAVVAAGPSASPAIVKRLLAEGIDVFVEKPPALTIADALSMQQASRDSGRQIAVGFMKRFATGYRMAKELASAPDFGSVALINARLSTGVWKAAWAPDIGARGLVLDHAIHFLDLMAFYGGPVVSITALPVMRDGARMGFACALRFASGAAGLLEISNMESRGVPNERVQIIGDNGHSVTVENVTSVTYSRAAKPMERDRAFDPANERLIWAPNMTNITDENSSLVHMGYVGEMRNFAASLTERTAVTPGIAEGIAALGLAEALLASDGSSVDPRTLTTFQHSPNGSMAQQS